MKVLSRSSGRIFFTGEVFRIIQNLYFRSGIQNENRRKSGREFNDSIQQRFLYALQTLTTDGAIPCSVVFCVALDRAHDDMISIFQRSLVVLPYPRVGGLCSIDHSMTIQGFMRAAAIGLCFNNLSFFEHALRSCKAHLFFL